MAGRLSRFFRLDAHCANANQWGVRRAPSLETGEGACASYAALRLKKVSPGVAVVTSAIES
jgi:hypothetical protein